MIERLDFSKHSVSISRRDFLKLSATGLIVFFTTGDLALFTGEVDSAPLPSDFNAFLRIGEKGMVQCYTGKIEMGQGVITSLAQMLADELDVAFEQVEMVMGDTDLCPYDRGTYGSLTTRSFGPALRQAGAEARAVLLELAAQHLDAAVDDLEVERGEIFIRKEPQRRVSYEELTQAKRIEHYVSGIVKPKSPGQFKVMNRARLRADALEKVTGAAEYAADIRLPDLLCARILRPPAHGATLRTLDTSRADAVPGARVVRDGDLVAVLHEKWDIADFALQLIQATFDEPEPQVDTDSIFAHLLEVAPSPSTLAADGNLAEGEGQSQTVVESTYHDGYVAHAPMEPHTATVSYDGDSATVWPSSQTPFPARDEAARTLGLPAEKVRVISPYLGGGFGGKTRNLQVQEAARLAKLTGKPVQVAWSREDEFFHDSFRPAAVVQIRSGLDQNRHLSFWDYHVYFAGDRGAEQFYNIAHHRTSSHGGLWGVSPGVHPFAVGAWRAPANNTNTFARESQIDIMAAQAGIDSPRLQATPASKPQLETGADGRREPVRLEDRTRAERPWTRHRLRYRRRHLGSHRGRSGGGQNQRRRRCNTRRLRTGHGTLRQSRRCRDPDGRLHHHGLGVCPERRDQIFRWCYPRQQLRHLRYPPLQLVAEDRNYHRRQCRLTAPGRR